MGYVHTAAGCGLHGEEALKIYSQGTRIHCKDNLPVCFAHHWLYVEAFREFRQVATVLHRAAVPFFLCKSTLLGYARMCDLEPNDNDFTLCIRAADLGDF